MRITKKMIRDAKRGMRKRINELCALTTTGGIQEEYGRCFPPYLKKSKSDVECLRSLLYDLLDLALSTDWYE